jgi:hypothetical protein
MFVGAGPHYLLKQIMKNQCEIVRKREKTFSFLPEGVYDLDMM